jgi:hypothetical protein
MRRRMFGSVTFISLGLFLLSACANTIHHVDVDKISANKNKVFQIGIVKVEGKHPFPWGDDVAKKITALERIPVEEICRTLTNNYAIQIDNYYVKTVRIVQEAQSGQAPSGPTGPGTTFSVNVSLSNGNPYFGNRAYEQKGLLERALTGGSPSIQNEDSGDMVYITYGFDNPPFTFKNDFYYEVMVKSDASILIHHRGSVAYVAMPMNGLAINYEGIWNNLISYADKINDALIKDINKYSASKNASSD